MTLVYRELNSTQECLLERHERHVGVTSPRDNRGGFQVDDYFNGTRYPTKRL